VVVDRADQVDQALAMLTERQAGRCGFLVLDDTRRSPLRPAIETPAGVRALRDVVRATGPYADLITRAVPDAWIAESLDQARAVSTQYGVPVATRGGEVCHGAGLIEGGAGGGTHGILETRAEVQTLPAQVADIE